MKHSDFWNDEPCNGELMLVEDAVRMAELSSGCQMLWCATCGAEFRYQPESKWVTVIYSGCVDKQ
jgi:hypothetical protein